MPLPLLAVVDDAPVRALPAELCASYRRRTLPLAYAAGAPAAIREAQPAAVLRDRRRDRGIRRLSTVVCVAHPLPSPGQRMWLRELGGVALAKPIDLAQLLAALREAVACRGRAGIALAAPEERRARRGDGQCGSS